MSWIYFGRDEPAAPSLKLPTLEGAPLGPADFRGLYELALFFGHGLGCPACHAFIDELAQASGELRAHGAEALVILPQSPAQPAPQAGGLHLLTDQHGALRRAYEAIFEFEVSSQPMLFVLNQHNAPFRAWMGAEPDPEILPQMLKYLEQAELLCPE